MLATALAKKPDDRFCRCIDFANALALAPSKPVSDRKYHGALKTPPPAAPTMPAPHWPKAAAAEPTAASPAPPASAEPTRVATPEDVAAFSRLLKPAKGLQETSKDANAQRSWRRKWRPIAVGIALLVLATFALAVRPWEGRGPFAASHPSRSPAAANQPIAFDSMRAFVEDYYADLPADPSSAWKKVDTQWQNKTGHQDFLDFGRPYSQ